MTSITVELFQEEADDDLLRSDQRSLGRLDWSQVYWVDVKRRVFQCSSVSTFKCSSIRVFQVVKYSSTQVFKCSSIQEYQAEVKIQGQIHKV